MGKIAPFRDEAHENSLINFCLEHFVNIQSKMGSLFESKIEKT